MDQQGNGQPHVPNVVPGAAPLTYGIGQYDSNQISGTPGRGSVITSVGSVQSTTPAPTGAQLAQQQLAYHQIHQQRQQQLHQQLKTFSANQYQEIEKVRLQEP